MRTGGIRLVAHHSSIRWYNPKLEDFEWRNLGASIGAALMRAGEAAKEKSAREKQEGDDAR